MKCAVAFALLLAGCSALLAGTSNANPSSNPATPASATRPPASLLEDLVRMTRTGEPNAAILVYAKAHRMELPPELSDATLRWLRDSGVHESVVRYLAAIDVRASDASAAEGVTYADQDGRAARERAAEYSENGDYDNGADDSGMNRHAEIYTGLSSNPDNGYGYGPYADYGYDSAYGYGSYPFFGYPYAFSPFPNFFIVNRSGSFRGHRGHRDHRFDGGGHRRGGIVRGPREAWRERGPGGRRGGGMAMGPRYSGRPAIARGGFGPALRGPGGPRGPRGPAMGFRRFDGPRASPGRFAAGPRAGGGGFRGPGPGRSFGGGRAAASFPSSGGRGRR